MSDLLEEFGAAWESAGEDDREEFALLLHADYRYAAREQAGLGAIYVALESVARERST